MPEQVERTVITRLKGGLGNQLFQYATGYALAERTGSTLLVDTSYLELHPASMDWTPRDLALEVFSAPLLKATEAQVKEARRSLDDRIARWTGRLSLGKRSWHVLMEQGTNDLERFAKIDAPAYLEGYWQDERFFLHVADQLRGHMFQPRDPMDERNAEVLARIGAQVSASLHVRLGDYRTNERSAAWHGVVDPAQQRSWARELVEQHGVEHFFVFCDEPDLVAQHLALPFPHTVVAHNTAAAAHWDIYLMKHCRHHIIANSSFSWWGAWLNPSPDKVVIAPARWFNGAERSNSIALPPIWTVR
jgi:hypothetical protein